MNGNQGSVDVVLPVYNEEESLRPGVEKLANFLQQWEDWHWEIVIADNASTDSTLEIAKTLGDQFPRVRVLHLSEKGRGRALKRAWLESMADVLVYMDIDLSTDLQALHPLVTAILTGGYDLSFGSRLAPLAKVYERTLAREILSRGYVTLIRLLFQTKFADAQCGFKAISREAAKQLLPKVSDPNFFFDTELLILAEKWGFKMCEIPVVWIDDPTTRVDILRTITQDIRGLMRLKIGGIPSPHS